jgi:hypothetical protein
MKRWKNTKNIGKHFIPNIVEAGDFLHQKNCTMNVIVSCKYRSVLYVVF